MPVAVEFGGIAVRNSLVCYLGSSCCFVLLVFCSSDSHAVSLTSSPDSYTVDSLGHTWIVWNTDARQLVLRVGVNLVVLESVSNWIFTSCQPAQGHLNPFAALRTSYDVTGKVLPFYLQYGVDFPA